MASNDPTAGDPKDTNPSTPPPAAEAPGAEDTPGDRERTFSLDLGEGVDEALKKLRDRATHYYKRGQHTQVRLKFRGKELTTLPLSVMVAMEAASWVSFGWLRLLVGNALGRTFLEVEFINEADQVVTSGKERLLDGELDEALDKFRQAITMDRDHPAAYLNLGIALKLKGQRDESIAAFEKAAALEPDGETGKEARRQLEKLMK